MISTISDEIVIILNVHSDFGGDGGCRLDATSSDCSGRGVCVCNVCECNKQNNTDEVIWGRYCECDNFSCERHKGLLCGGPEHGICECGRCLCRLGWTGDDCTCRTSNDTCIPPDGGEICSGRGTCICGACKCQETGGNRYSGKYCKQ